MGPLYPNYRSRISPLDETGGGQGFHALPGAIPSGPPSALGRWSARPAARSAIAVLPGTTPGCGLLVRNGPKQYCITMFYAVGANGMSPEPFAELASRRRLPEAGPNPAAGRTGLDPGNLGLRDGVLSPLPTDFQPDSQPVLACGTRLALARSARRVACRNPALPAPGARWSAQDLRPAPADGDGPPGTPDRPIVGNDPPDRLCLGWGGRLAAGNSPRHGDQSGHRAPSCQARPLRHGCHLGRSSRCR